MTTKARIAIAAFFLIAALLVATRLAGLPIGQVLEALCIGWFRFLTRVLPRQQVSTSGFATGLVCISLLAIGLQGFFGWLVRSWPDEHGAPRKWRFRWTFYLLAMTVVMFTAGTAFVGVVHQTTWLVTSPEPTMTSAADPALLLKPQLQLSFIYGALDGSFGYLKGLSPETMPSDDGLVRPSWQTAILPYLSINAESYDDKRSWNDPANKDACRRPVPEYLIPGVQGELHDANGYAISHYAGNEHVFLAARERPLRFKEMNAEIVIVGEAAGNFKPWADPANLRDPLDGICTSADAFGNTQGTGCYFLKADGRVRFISADVDPSVLQAISGESLRQGKSKP